MRIDSHLWFIDLFSCRKPRAHSRMTPKKKWSRLTLLYEKKYSAQFDCHDAQQPIMSARESDREYLASERAKKHKSDKEPLVFLHFSVGVTTDNIVVPLSLRCPCRAIKFSIHANDQLSPPHTLSRKNQNNFIYSVETIWLPPYRTNLTIL